MVPPDCTPADFYFINLLTQLTKIFDDEERQGRSVTAELRHRDMEWVWRGQPGFVGYPMHGNRNIMYRFDRETRKPVLW